MKQSGQAYPAMLALVAAVLFGASAPLAKVFLGHLDPVPLAGLLYFGSGLALLVIRLFQSAKQSRKTQEAQLRGKDFGWLMGSIVAGGILAPILLLYGLRVTAAATASLLLNFEAVSTTLIAMVLFKEAIGRRAWLAVALITLSGILLSLNLDGSWGVSIGAVGIIAACFLWGLDNNFTRNISAKDPLVIAMVKGLVAGIFSLALAYMMGASFPSIGIIIGALLLGSLCYGLSIVLFIRAMRSLGAARTSALFGVAPLVGVVLSFLIFHGSPTLAFYLALPLMVAGAAILIREQHSHFHVHAELIHEHAHSHDDDHHIHEHESLESERHSHVHRHEELQHEHQHMPDLHHRHSH